MDGNQERLPTILISHTLWSHRKTAAVLWSYPGKCLFLECLEQWLEQQSRALWNDKPAREDWDEVALVLLDAVHERLNYPEGYYYTEELSEDEGVLQEDGSVLLEDGSVIVVQSEGSSCLSSYSLQERHKIVSFLDCILRAN